MIDYIYYLEEIELFQFLIVIDDEDEEFIWFGDGTLLVITVNEKQNSRWNILQYYWKPVARNDKYPKQDSWSAQGFGKLCKD